MDYQVILGAVLIAYIVLPYLWIYSRQERVWAREKGYLYKGTESRQQVQVGRVSDIWFVGMAVAMVAYYFNLILLSSAVLIVFGVAMVMCLRRKAKG